MRNFYFLAVLLVVFGCTKKSDKTEIWIYTSLYKDTIADISPKLEAQFPKYKVNFFQAGSEDVAAKLNAEAMSGSPKADIVIFSDRFWFEEMVEKKFLHKYKPKNWEGVSDTLKHRDGFYTTLSIPVMVMIYNSEAISDPPKSFKEMAEPKWKDKFNTGSPLASGTNFTTVAFLQKAYGWEYFKALQKNGTISEGGNSSVIRRVQTKERPVGWVLLENFLRLKADSKIKVIYPEDGPIIQTNVLGIIEKDQDRKPAEEVTDWLFSPDGQQAMIRSFMYGTVPGTPPPVGAPPLEGLMTKAPKWTPEVIQEFMKNRESLKEEFSKIMFE